MTPELITELLALVREARILIPRDGIFAPNDQWHTRAEMALRRAEAEREE